VEGADVALAGHHQTCLPQLLRHLNYLDERYGGQQWAASFRKLLHDAIELDRDAVGDHVVRTRTL
jgi:hypothetical protein